MTCPRLWLSKAIEGGVPCGGGGVTRARGDAARTAVDDEVPCARGEAARDEEVPCGRGWCMRRDTRGEVDWGRGGFGDLTGVSLCFLGITMLILYLQLHTHLVSLIKSLDSLR